MEPGTAQVRVKDLLDAALNVSDFKRPVYVLWTHAGGLSREPYVGVFWTLVEAVTYQAGLPSFQGGGSSDKPFVERHVLGRPAERRTVWRG